MSQTNTCSLALIGDGSVGKSTIINAFCTEGFQKVYKQTIGCDFFEKQIEPRVNYSVSLRVWDIGGQSIHSKNLRSYLEHANAIMLVYDITNLESFHNLQDWLMQLKKYNNTEYIYVIGNKADLIALRQVSLKQHDAFIADNAVKGGNFCSAKTGENIVKMFYAIAGEIIGIKLTEYELAFHDKVLKAHVNVSNEQDEIRNAWADDIEKEDLEAERKKQQGDGACCILS